MGSIYWIENKDNDITIFGSIVTNITLCKILILSGSGCDGGEIMAAKLVGQTALVTGGGRGIGLGITTCLIREGAKVIIAGRTSNVFSISETLGDNVIPCQTDISDCASVRKTISPILEKLGGVDILVNNAGISRLCQFMDLSEEILDQHVKTNVLGAVYCTKLAIPYIVGHNYGRIINISSVTGPFVADPGDCAYALTKAALIGFTKSLSVEFAAHNITVNAICPGYVLSDMVKGSASISNPQNPQQILDDIAGSIPLGRLGTPRDIGELAVFLASEEAAYITGQAIIIDGGNSIPETISMGLRT